MRLQERVEAGDQPRDADWRSLVILAIRAGHRLTAEAFAGLGLIGTYDLTDYLDAIINGPKAQPAADA